MKEHGGRTAATPAAAAEGADFVFACVGNDSDLRAVTTGNDGAFAGMKPGAVFIDNTTASADVARELHAIGKAKGFGVLDAPVSGGQAGAQNGVLTVMVGGDEDQFAKALPVIEPYARMVRRIGPAGAGQLAKMVNQICIAGFVQGLSEGVHFAQRAGLDIPAVMETISKGRRRLVADGEPLENHGGRQVRLRLRRRLDAQGPRHLPRGSAAQWRQPAGDGAGRSVLFGSPATWRTSLGYVEPGRPPQQPACRPRRQDGS